MESHTSEYIQCKISERKLTDQDLEPIKDWGKNSITKNQMDKLFRRGINFPLRILSRLREMHPQKILGPNNFYISNPDYANGIVLPSKLQIRNYVNNTLKPKQVKPIFSYADLYN